MTTNLVLEVDRGAFGDTRITEEELPALADGQVRLRIDRFALTANNITYAVFGDMLGYWDFFPTAAEPGRSWGRVPAMGWADVVESSNPDVPTGGRYYGWFPMARYLDITASATDDGLRDDGEHRQAHAAVYRSYVERGRDPWYPSDADDIGDAEDRHALLRGLFMTSFLADCFFADRSYFGAEQAVVLSASSKTAVGFAQRAASRGLGSVVGVTSAANTGFVEALGWYDRVVTYDDIADDLPLTDSVSIDMAGDAAALAAVHERLGDHLKYSMIIGKSHHDAPLADITTGPTPELFFAPTEVSRRMEEWGPDEYQRRTRDALVSFVEESTRWLEVRRDTGATGVQATYRDVYDGAVPPSVGRVASMHE